MLYSFSRMLPELLRHSDRPDTFELIPDHLKDVHRPRRVERDDAPAGRPDSGGRAGKKRAGGAAGRGRGRDRASGSGGGGGGSGGGLFGAGSGADAGGILDLWGDDVDGLPPLQAVGAGTSMANAFSLPSLGGGLDDAEAEALLDDAGF